MLEKQHDMFYVVNSDNDILGIGIDIALPGFKKDHIEISTTQNTLKVSGKEVLGTEETRQYVRSYNRIDREAFSVEFSIDEFKYNLDKLTAELTDGILKIRIPVGERAKSKVIKIK